MGAIWDMVTCILARLFFSLSYYSYRPAIKFKNVSTANALKLKYIIKTIMCII